ncbi:MAG: hypothetical protein IPK71_23085 [Myxococcales bacterium]|nr:hypothetical protein [Myxococcales bacterium]
MSAVSTFGWDEALDVPFFDVDGDRVRLLVDGSMAFRAMLSAIRSARREVLLEMYWVGDDPVGTRFRAELAAAARRGVMVRIVFDAFGSLGLPGDFWAPVEREGGIVYAFHALSPFARRFRLDFLERRDHRKLLVVDGTTGFLGGINLALPWLPRECGERPSATTRSRSPALASKTCARSSSKRGATSPVPARGPPLPRSVSDGWGVSGRSRAPRRGGLAEVSSGSTSSASTVRSARSTSRTRISYLEARSDTRSTALAAVAFGCVSSCPR